MVSQGMRILYFHQHFSTPRGATGTRSYEMAKQLIARGHQVTMVCGSYGIGATGLNDTFTQGRRRGTIDGIDVIELDLCYSNTDSFFKRISTFLKFAIASIGCVFREEYDIAFATTTPLTAGIPGIFARWFRRKHFVFEVRDLWPELPKAMGAITNPIILSAMGVLEWLSYRSAHRCVALSPGIARGIARRGVEEEKIALLPNGCDIAIFRDPDLKPWRPDGVADTDLMAIFTGTFGQANGVDAVLDAAAILQARGRTDIKLVLIGDGKQKPLLVERVTRDALENVIFHAPVPKIHLAGLMASADLGLQCLANVEAFYYGTSPNKFFDYIAAGLPVLNNYPGWLADIIRSHDCGWVVPPEEAGLFADVLEEAAADRAGLADKGVRAARLADQHFARSNLADAWVDWVTEYKHT